MSQTFSKWLFAGIGLCFCPYPVHAEEIVVPTEYDQHRYFAVPRIAGGENMRLLVDTGGGVFLFDDAAIRLRLTVTNITLEEYRGMGAQFPTFEKNQDIPQPKLEDGKVPVTPSPVRAQLPWLTKNIDGFLGQNWFADRVWTLDYPNRKLIFHSDGKVKVAETSKKTTLGFQTNERGERALSFPRLEVTIMGKTYDMLLATGCSTMLTADATKVIDDGVPSLRAASLISTTTFENWQKEHPNWRVIPNAEEVLGEPMIEVPEVTIAGHSIGPIWFTRRTDKNFSEHFSNWTDKPVIGAIGGNVLRHFRLVLDYPSATAWFEKP